MIKLTLNSFTLMASLSDKRKFTVFLSLGSNLGKRKRHLAAASEAIKNKLGKIIVASSIYETEAWGSYDLQPFLNQVLQIESTLKPLEMLAAIQGIEKAMGRVRKKVNQYENRPIDIDILAFENKIIEESELIIPHPRIPQRKFILEAFKEIAPQHVLPKWNKSIHELYQNCEDRNSVIKI